jgi:hypothetical protein
VVTTTAVREGLADTLAAHGGTAGIRCEQAARLGPRE